MENPFAPYECQFNKEDRRRLIARTIKELRERKGLSQKEIATLLDIPQTTYSGYERRVSDIPQETLVRLSYLYDTSLDIIMQRNVLVKNSNELETYLENQDIALDETLQELIKKGMSKEEAEKIVNPMRQLIGASKELAKNEKLREELNNLFKPRK